MDEALDTTQHPSTPQPVPQPAPAAPAYVPDPRLSGTGLSWLLNNVEVEIEGGMTSAHDALTQALKQANQAVNAAAQFSPKGASAKLTIDIKLTAEKGVVNVEIGHKLTLPKPMKAAPSMFWPTRDGGFSLENPRQLNLFQPKPAIGS